MSQCQVSSRETGYRKLPQRKKDLERKHLKCKPTHMDLSRRGKRTEVSTCLLRQSFPGQVVRDKPPSAARHVYEMY